MIKNLITFYNYAVFNKKNFYHLQALVFFSGFLEILGLGLILPYFNFIQEENGEILKLLKDFLPLNV